MPSKAKAAAAASTAAALTYAGWSPEEAADRIKELITRGWSVAAIARLFGVSESEAVRLAGERGKRLH